MRASRRTAVIVLAAPVLIWLTAHLMLEVQLPDRQGRRNPPLAPMEETSLLQAFESLPAEGGENTRVRLLEKNVTAWLERWRLLDQAERRLDISYFILKQDIFGMAFLGHLVQKAHEGVEIRLLLDAMGTNVSRSFRGNDYLDTLVNTEKVVVKMYRPLPFRYLDAFLTLNPAAIFVSDHDKIILADRRWGLVGGRNISQEYFAPLSADPRAFRDTDLVLYGPEIGRALETAFEAQFSSGEAHDVRRETLNIKDSSDELLLAYRAMDAWLRDAPLPPDIESRIREGDMPWLKELEEMPQLRGALGMRRPDKMFTRVQLIDSRCRLLEADDHITRSLVRLVRSARTEIFIQSPYLVLSREAAAVLAEAADRGVRITILTNSPLSSDNAMSQGVFLEQWPELLARIPDIRLFVPYDKHNLHGKVAIIDRQLSLVGTYNLDPLSMALNSELVVAAWSEPLAEELLSWRERAIAAGPPAMLRYRLERGPEGDPLRDAKGRPVVAFGATDHLSPEQMSEALDYRKYYRWIWKVARDSPLF